MIHNSEMLQTDKAYLTDPAPLVYPRVDATGNKISDTPVTWKRKLNFQHEGKNVRGFIMIMDRGSYHGPGVRLLRNRRVIAGTRGGDRQNKPKVLLGTSNKYAPQRIYGEITLNEFPVNFMKTGFDINMNSLYHAIKSQISAIPPDNLDDYVQQATNFRTKKAGKQTGRKPAPRPRPLDKIPFSDDLRDKLAELEFNKLYRLYESLCNISLSEHPILAYVGVWSLLDSMATQMGKRKETAFNSFFTGNILNTSEFADTARKEIRNVINDIHAKGNMNKHSGSYQTINAQQLAGDLPVIQKFLIHCVVQHLSSSG